MSKIIDIPTIADERGKLSVIENIAGFNIKRVYFIYDTDGKPRGGHRHKKTEQILVCVSGSCNIFCQNELRKESKYLLDNPKKGILLDPKDWHTMENFSDDCILLVLASETYDKDDYIDERY